MDAELIRYKKLIAELEKEIQKLTGNMEEIVANLKERLGVTDKLTHAAVLILSEKDFKALSKELKQACGSGGTIKDGVIEIQGEHRQKIADVLTKQGYKVKISGG